MFQNRKTLNILGSYGLMAAFFLTAVACSGTGALAPGGGALGENPPAAGQVAFNPGSVQSGGEGHGQEQKKTPHFVSVTSKDGRGNCGIPATEVQEVFAPEGPILHLSFGGTETGTFSGITTAGTGRFGRGPVPECPTAVPIVEGGVRRFQIPGFVRIVATLTDASGKNFQSLPKIVSCQAECASPPCEVCIDLKDASEIPDSEGVDPIPGETDDGLKRIDPDLFKPIDEDSGQNLPVLFQPKIDPSHPLKLNTGPLNP